MEEMTNISKKIPRLSERELFYFWRDDPKSKKLEAYIKSFIKDKLSFDDKNYLLFKKQKEEATKLLNKDFERFGRDYCAEDPLDNNEFLFLHSFLALEILDYIDIHKIYITDYAGEPLWNENDDRWYIKINLEVLDKFIEENPPKKLGFEFLITKNEATDKYLYKEKEIDINQDKLPYKIFDIVYTHSDANGFISYENIEKHLRNIGEISINTKVRNKKVNNNLTNESVGFFRYAKIDGKLIKNINPANKKPLIYIKRGKGIIFNNLAN